MINVANYLSQDGFDVDLISATRKQDLDYLVSDSVNVVHFKRSRVRYSLFPLLRYLKNRKPDVLLATPYRSAVIAGLSQFLSKANVPTTLRVPVTLSNERFYTSPAGLSDQVLPKILSITHRRADSLIAISNGVKKDLVENFNISPEDVDVIYNPVITDDIYTLIKEPVKHPFFGTDSPVYIGVGRLTEQKNFSALIRSFARVRNENNGRLIILGKGRLESELKELTRSLGISDYVSFVGFVENPYKYVYNSDVFVLSSSWEGFGNVIVEALACQTQIVSTDCESGPAEILENGKYGDLVPVGDDSQFASKMLEATNNRIKKERLKRRAQDFHVNNIVPQYRSHLLDQIN